MKSEFECGTKSRDLRSCGEVITVNALGFYEFQSGTRHGSDEGGVTRFGTSQGWSAMSHECDGMCYIP